MIEELNRAGHTILLVQQKAQKALGIAHYAYVPETGRIVSEGRATRSPKTPS
jgi:branched-chain amino acid transport system ATP-binding protein